MKITKLLISFILTLSFILSSAQPILATVYTYDANGGRTGIITESGDKFLYTYDTMGNLTFSVVNQSEPLIINKPNSSTLKEADIISVSFKVFNAENKNEYKTINESETKNIFRAGNTDTDTIKVTALSPSSSGNLVITVRDSVTNAPLPYASIHMECTETGTGELRRADHNGMITLTAPEGRYIVAAYTTGYLPNDKSFDIIRSQVLSSNVNCFNKIRSYRR